MNPAPDIENREELADALDAEPELLPAGEQEPRVIVNGKPELILPNDNRSFSQCAGQCFEYLGDTGKFFLQGNLVVELEKSDGDRRIVELTPEAFRSRLEEHFELRAVLREGNREVLRQKLCSLDNAKALLKTSAVGKFLPPIQTILNSPVFAEDKEGRLTVLSQGYHRLNGGTYVLADRNIVEDIGVEKAIEHLLSLIEDFSFASPSDKSRCVAGLISPALRFGRLLKVDFPMDLCEADQSQTGKGFRADIISKIYDENPVVLTLQSSRGVGSMDDSISAALLSGKGFVIIDNMRGSVNSQLLESAIKGARGTVMARTAYGRSTQVKTDHVVWMGTSNRAEVTEDLANRCIITRLRKRPLNYTFKKFNGLGLMGHIEKKKDFFLSCVFAVVRDWIEKGKPSNPEVQHDFREWCGALDWIVQNIFKLPPLLDGHRDQQERISSPGLNFSRDVCKVIAEAGRLHEWLTAGDIVAELDAANIEIPGRSKSSEVGSGAIAVGKLLKPLFKNSEEREIEEFKIRRSEKLEYNTSRQQNMRVKRYSVFIAADPLKGMFKEGGTGYSRGPEPEAESKPKQKPKQKEEKPKRVYHGMTQIVDKFGKTMQTYSEAGKTFVEERKSR